MDTFAELAGAGGAAPENDGQSIVPALMGEVDNEKRFLYWETDESRACRWGDWKVVQPRPGAPLELYDLAKDREERDDVAAEHEALVARMAARMDGEHEEPPPQMEPSAPDGRYYR